MEYTKRKLDSSYSRHVNDIIKLISINSKNINIIGSFANKSALYSGDIDMNETVIENGSPIEASKKIAKNIQNIIKNLLKRSDVLIGDFKAGIYQPLFIDIGYVSKGAIIGYDPIRIRKEIKDNYLTKIEKKDLDIYNKKYGEEITLSSEELLKLIKDKPSLKEFLELQEIIRKEYIFRWDTKDILNGYQLYEKGGHDYKYYLDDAIRDKSIVKLDLLYPINGRMIEVTNVFLCYYKEKGKVKSLNVVEDVTFLERLKKDLLELVASKDKNYLKAVKRLASIAKYEKDYDLLGKLIPILNSGLGIMYQVIGDSKALIYYIKNIKHLPFDFILNEIDLFRTRLANVFEFQFNEEKIDNQITNILNHKYQQNETSRKFIIERLKTINDELMKVLNKKTFEALEKIHLLPIPQKYWL